MDYQWKYFMDLATNYPTWTSSAGSTIHVGQSVFLSYTGAGIALLLSVVGAYDNSGQTLVYVEDSIADFIRHFANGHYEDILALADENQEFKNLLNEFSLHLIMYTAASLFHSAVLIASGTFGAFWILYKLKGLQD